MAVAKFSMVSLLFLILFIFFIVKVRKKINMEIKNRIFVGLKPKILTRGRNS